MKILVGPRAWHKLPLSRLCPATWGKVKGEEVEADAKFIEALAEQQIWPCLRCS